MNIDRKLLVRRKGEASNNLTEKQREGAKKAATMIWNDNNLSRDQIIYMACELLLSE